MARDILREVSPQWVLLVGIAGGLPASEFTIGDVVLSVGVLDFSVEAIKSGAQTEFAVEGRVVDHRVENYATTVAAHRQALGHWFQLTTWQDGKRNTLEFPDLPMQTDRFHGTQAWQDEARKALSQHLARKPRVPLVTGVTIGSSDRLIKDSEIIQVWTVVARHLRAVEMESAGVHIAARPRGRGRKGFPAMSIRGISDIVGYKRDESWTRYACHSAAAFAYAFVRSGHVQPRVKRNPGNRVPSRPAASPVSDTGANDSAAREPISEHSYSPLSSCAVFGESKLPQTQPLTYWEDLLELLSRIEATLKVRAPSFTSIFVSARMAAGMAYQRAAEGEVAMTRAKQLLAGKVPKVASKFRDRPTFIVAKREDGEQIDFGATIWDSGDEYFGHVRHKQPSGVGVYKIYCMTQDSTPNSINFYRGELSEGLFGRYGVYQFHGSNIFLGEWVDQRPLLGVYGCDALAEFAERAYGLYVGEMGEEKLLLYPATSTREDVFQRRWCPHGRGVALTIDHQHLICGRFSYGEEPFDRNALVAFP